MAKSLTVLKSLPYYRHQSLSSGACIRIIALEPATDNASRLRCTLIERDITKPGLEYEALSYCWGTNPPSRPIECDGCKLLVTANCESALRRLRYGHHPRLLWIDSICIDQNSDTDRNHQVALMGEIYKAAAQVIIWLGEGNSKTALAFASLGTIGRTRLAYYRGRREEALESVEAISAQTLEDLSHVFMMLWFYRLWTVQEVTLPDMEKVLVCCGHSGYPWETLMNAAAYIQVHPTLNGRWDEATRLQRHISGRLKAAKGQSEVLSGSMIPSADETPRNILSMRTALSILITAREKQSTKPEDRVFSLYSVFKELGVQIPLPDYRKPVPQIFAEAAIACIEDDQSLHILLEALSDTRRAGLPSWVPDWSSPGWLATDPRRHCLHYDFNAAGLSVSTWNFKDNRQLVTRGTIIDIVRDCGPPLQFGDRTDKCMETRRLPLSESRNEELSYELNACFEVLKHWTEIAMRQYAYSTRRARTQAFIRIAFYDGSDSKNQDDRIKSLLRWYDLITGENIDDVSLSFLPVNMTVWSQAMTRGPWLYHLSILRCARNKSFFRTQKGVYGIAVRTVRLGDKVALISGVRVPVILRESTGGTYCYVGFAAVDGYMYG